MDSLIGMLGYNEVTSKVTRMVSDLHWMDCNSVINVWLLDSMCVISLTIGLSIVSRKAEILLVGELMRETIGLTLIGVLCGFFKK